MQNQYVYVIPYNNTLDIDNGFTYCTEKQEKNVWKKYNNGKYVLKEDAEGHPEIQQLIPYIIIQDIETNEFLTYESKSSKKISIAINDHIKSRDGIKDPLFQASIRCLLENLMLSELNPLIFKGYVRDMNSNINDHLGIVFLLKITSKDKAIYNNKQITSHWLTKKDLIDKYGRLESWSKYIVDYMVENTL